MSYGYVNNKHLIMESSKHQFNVEWQIFIQADIIL